ncbi:Uncharacterised protein [Vibrio cholerae]|nr:Uncharacterised protein [Vibrio cholerae]CSC61701.1 Uncharacterised protein [Vibrio cholerae]
MGQSKIKQIAFMKMHRMSVVARNKKRTAGEHSLSQKLIILSSGEIGISFIQLNKLATRQ